MPVFGQGVPGAIPLPDVTGPIPVTADSYPMMAAAQLQDVVDLPKAGYVEEEFLISGRANIYDWDSSSRLTVKTSGAPYTTRILVRRPANPANFSGNVVIELGNAARRFDWAFTWSLSYEHFLESGDAWISLTYVPTVIEALKAFNGARYSSLSMANPAPTAACTSNSEEGLRWDMMSQLGALLKSDRAGRPLAGFRVERVYATSHGGELPTYIAAIHPHAKLANGQSIYDGYVVHRHGGLVRMSQCAAAPAENDPRHTLRNVSVPVIRIVAQTDVLGTYARRREDSDAPGDRYRLYEMAGAAHADAAFYRHLPSLAAQTAVGTQPFLNNWPFANKCEPEISLMKTPTARYTINAAFANLTRWVRDGIAPPRAERIQVRNPGTPQASIVTDEYGNAVGGTRTPYLNVPTATYFTTAGGGGTCGNLAYNVPFDWMRLEKVYGSYQNYSDKASQSIDQLVRDRWLTESDGRKIKRELVLPQQSSNRED